jgi:hypothetical protein
MSPEWASSKALITWGNLEKSEDFSRVCWAVNSTLRKNTSMEFSMGRETIFVFNLLSIFTVISDPMAKTTIMIMREGMVFFCLKFMVNP